MKIHKLQTKEFLNIDTWSDDRRLNGVDDAPAVGVDVARRHFRRRIGGRLFTRLGLQSVLDNVFIRR
jgi:hypothetical protein